MQALVFVVPVQRSGTKRKLDTSETDQCLVTQLSEALHDRIGDQCFSKYLPILYEIFDITVPTDTILPSLKTKKERKRYITIFCNVLVNTYKSLRNLGEEFLSRQNLLFP